MGTMMAEGEESFPKDLQICNLCNRAKCGDGNWYPLEKVYISPHAKVTHGFCLDCCEKTYMTLPEIKHLLADKIP